MKHPRLWLAALVFAALLVLVAMCGQDAANDTPATPEPSAPLYEPTEDPLPTPDPSTPAPTKAKPKPARTTAAATYYGSCGEARAAGAAPLHRGDPGYSRELDRDGDGVACE